MSRIVALFHRDLRPLAPDILARIVAPLRNSKSDGPRFWARGSAGLAFQCLRKSCGPDDFQPAGSGERHAVCFDGRLDNRDELIRELGSDLSGEAAFLPDAAIVLACYRCFGETFAARLNGDFALALVDLEAQRVLLARDVMGIRPLYYWSSDDTLIAASEIKAILAHPGVAARPDENALADMLLGGNPNERRLTGFRDIRRLLPGHTAVVEPEREREFQHWNFDPTAQIRLGSIEEYSEALRGLFGQAVRRRLRVSGDVAVAVSGGLDSSAILCQAETLRSEGAAIPPVHGICRLFAQGSPADERRYLADIEARYRVAIRRLPPTRPRKPDFQAWPARMEYPELPGNAYLECLELASELSCSTVLHGDYGDQVLWSYGPLFDLMRGLRWREAHRAFRALCRSYTDSSPRILRQELFHAFVRDLVPDAAMKPIRGARRLVDSHRSPRWYSSRFRGLAYRRSQQQCRATGPFASKHAELCYTLVRSAHIVTGMELSNKVASWHGLEKAYPFADRDLIAFIMAIPGEIVTWKGVYKGLFREAARGILPESIRQRTWKADFTPHENEVASQSFADLEQSLGADCLAISRGYVDRAALSSCLSRHMTRMTARNSLPGRQLTGLLAFEFWLRAFFANGHS